MLPHTGSHLRAINNDPGAMSQRDLSQQASRSASLTATLSQTASRAVLKELNYNDEDAAITQADARCPQSFSLLLRDVTVKWQQ